MRKFLLLLVLLLTACQPMAVQRRDQGPVPVALRVDDAAYWLEEWSRLRELPAAQIKQALEHRNRDYARRPDTRARLRLALLLAEGPPSVRDEPRALSLLAELDAQRASASSRALAQLLLQVLREKTGKGDKIAVLQQNLRASEARVKTLEPQLRELERQLQELTHIEQSIQQRETPVERKEK